MKKLGAYVSKADGKQVRVRVPSSTSDARLESLGFTFDSKLSEYIKDAPDITEKVKLFSALRDADVYFSDGKEWCPSELFEYFREQNLISGKFKRVSWLDPQNFTIREV